MKSSIKDKDKDKELFIFYQDYIFDRIYIYIPTDGDPLNSTELINGGGHR